MSSFLIDKVRYRASGRMANDGTEREGRRQARDGLMDPLDGIGVTMLRMDNRALSETCGHDHGVNGLAFVYGEHERLSSQKMKLPSSVTVLLVTLFCDEVPVPFIGSFSLAQNSTLSLHVKHSTIRH